MKTSKPRNLVIWGVLFVGLMLTTACSDHNDVPDGYTLKTSLTEVFIMPEHQENGTEANYTLECNQSGGIIYLDVKGKFIDSGNDPKLFNQLLDKYNDHYPKPKLRPTVVFDPLGYVVLGEPITGVEVKSLDDFNASHQKGADMGDMVYLEWWSYYDYIQGGYETSAMTGNGSYLEGGGTAKTCNYHGLIGDSSIYPIRMVDFTKFFCINLYFSQKPDAPGTYRFSVRFKFESCEATTTMTVKF